MNPLQIRLFGPYSSSFLLHSRSYRAANELESVLKHPAFRFGPSSPTVSLRQFNKHIIHCDQLTIGNHVKH